MSKVVTGADVVMVSVDKLEPNPWNPQEMTDGKFNQLVDEIREDGFDEPILVVAHPSPDKANDGWYMIIAGEHRWQSARVLGLPELPCIVKEGWNERAQKLKTVRRNLIHGDLSKSKFAKLVHSLSDDGMSLKDMPGAMGFKDEAEFREAFVAQEKTREKEKEAKALKDAQERERRETEVVDNLSYILNEILSQYGDTVPQGFMFFWHKNKFHLMVQEDDKLEKKVEAAVKYLRETGKHVTAFLNGAFDMAFNEIEAEDGTDPRKIRRISGKVEDSENSDGTDEQTGDDGEDGSGDGDDSDGGEFGEAE